MGVLADTNASYECPTCMYMIEHSYRCDAGKGYTEVAGSCARTFTEVEGGTLTGKLAGVLFSPNTCSELLVLFRTRKHVF